jgi:hypothetical protein
MRGHRRQRLLWRLASLFSVSPPPSLRPRHRGVGAAVDVLVTTRPTLGHVATAKTVWLVLTTPADCSRLLFLVSSPTGWQWMSCRGGSGVASPVAEAPGGRPYIAVVIAIIAVVALLLGLSAATASQLAPALRS